VTFNVFAFASNGWVMATDQAPMGRSGSPREAVRTKERTIKIEWDKSFGLVKCNPLADWTWENVWEYVREHNVPYNALHEQNYPSIGCVQCTRQVQPGEDPRAGRWSGFAKKECGLHTPE